MKKYWKILIIAAAALGVMAATCPGRQRHLDELVQYMGDSLHKQTKSLVRSYEKQHDNESMPDKGKQMLTMLEENLINQLRPAFDNVLAVRNFVLFSVGRLENKNDESLRVSVGFLGMVFIRNKGELKWDLSI